MAGELSMMPGPAFFLVAAIMRRSRLSRAAGAPQHHHIGELRRGVHRSGSAELAREEYGCIRICLRRGHARKREARRALVMGQGIGDSVDRHSQHIVDIKSPRATSDLPHRDAAAHRIILSSKRSEQDPVHRRTRLSLPRGMV